MLITQQRIPVPDSQDRDCVKMAGVLDSIEYHEGEIEEALEKLKDFVEKRNQEGWDVIH